jgi:hypothetical protein
MSRYHRRGHWRTSANGTHHWVSGHSVNRDSYGWFGGTTRAPVRPRPAVPAPQRVFSDEPNATCPVCGDAVWFFRSQRGGCAYFDAVGKPWPKHPCMDQRASALDHQAAGEAITAHERWQKANKSPDEMVEDGWWLNLSVLFAWLLSLPISAALYREVAGDGRLAFHWFVTLPSVTLGVSLLLVLSGKRLGGAVLKAPLLLVGGIFLNGVTCGLALPCLAVTLPFHDIPNARKYGRRSAA